MRDEFLREGIHAYVGEDCACLDPRAHQSLKLSAAETHADRRERVGTCTSEVAGNVELLFGARGKFINSVRCHGVRLDVAGGVREEGYEGEEVERI